jgi:DNA-binding HxlR family transcriptional regulator
MGHMSASYGQFCPIATASEIFATRWTPLIVREMMFGVHSFNDIHRGVPLISRAVLIARLRELEDHGVIERRPRGADGAGHEYWLTRAGEPHEISNHLADPRTIRRRRLHEGPGICHRSYTSRQYP